MADPQDSELVGTAQRLSAGLVEGLHLRLALVETEVAEERKRITDLVVSALVTALAVFLLLVAINVAVVIFFWDTHRDAVAIGMCLVYTGLAAGAVLQHRRRRRLATPLFAATRAVLAEDERVLRELL